MNDLTPFTDAGEGLDSKHFGVDDRGRVYVQAAAFAKAMGYRDATNATRLLEEDEKGTQIVSTPGGDQRVAVIYEHGMWELIFRSSKPGAKTLKSRVKEILTEIRVNGGYISPSATEAQLAAIIGRAESQARVLHALRGVVDKQWLEAKGRHVAARALGEEPEVDLINRPLTVGEYLEDKGVTGEALRSLSPRFGKALKAAYVDRYDRKPGTVERFIDGALRPVAAYTERHRPLFDRVWRELSAVAS